MKKIFGLLCYFILCSKLFASPIKIVAVENFYATLVKEIGGPYVEVVSIINNPNTDPHLFTLSFATSRALNNAKIVIYNGANYDSWVEPLIKPRNQILVNVANLINLEKEANPHIWYKPETMPTLAKYLTQMFSDMDKAHTKEFKSNLNSFLVKNKLIDNKISYIKAKFKQLPVTATEPIFNYMANALGFEMQNIDLQWKIMNGSEPNPKMFANYVKSLKQKKVKLVFYNSQVTNSTVSSIITIAKTNDIPTIAISEIMPAHYKSVNSWILDELDRILQILQKRSSL